MRDRAIILLLLDIGMRASELCELTIHQVNLKTKQVKVFGKGDAERILQISPTTSKALWKYLSTEWVEERAHAPAFMGRNGEPLTRSGLLQLLRSLGERTGVRDCHPHRFRHTFAVNFLRNGANIYALQMSLGHTTLTMVQRYLMLAQADLEAAHKQASPMENWRL